ncbi:L-fucose mutarotase [Mycetocola sp. BIGb0189]|uniref:RbsD/FucU family protein n=1 Tax=Mycetocola sp. BIGb0189 TaxID=2940604 RepID=UPI0021671AC0|nr:RbsD/FucU domain-containing protein [Mycetocola sp. BIGb0189]MCS4277203.1 L-fucose mutarotase [Mycetocola sp. BIGb0189]
MLKGIDPLLSADLLYAIARMGHGDVLAVVDRNYPAHAAGAEVITLPGIDVTRLAKALFTVFPVDTFIPTPIGRMEVVGEPEEIPEVQRELFAAAEAAEGRAIGIESIERFEFYVRARSAFAVIATTDDRPYGCFLITKGVV